MSGEPDFQDYLDEAEDQIGGCHECHPHQRIRLMSELLELAERCEQATGPDRKLDYAIVKAVGYSDDRPYTEGDGWRMPLSFTASLDAAMTLYIRVPERLPSNPRKAAAEALRQRAETA